MDGPIELSGVTPLTESSIIQVLNAASSLDLAQVNASYKQFQEWETEQGFYSFLQDAFMSVSLPLNVRLMAIIQLKNGIDKYWRKSAANAIRAEERTKIRSRLLLSSVDIDQKDSQLVTMNAIVTARIARYDFPAQWPSLPHDLMQLLHAMVPESAASQRLRNVLRLVLQVVKELATVRLQRSRANIYTMTPELFQVLRDLYITNTSTWMPHLTNLAQGLKSPVPELELHEVMSTSLEILRIIRRLVVAGYEFPHKDQDVQVFWNTTFIQVQTMLEIFHCEFSPKLRESVGKHIAQLTKFYQSMALNHEVCFALLNNSIEIVQFYWALAKQIRRRQKQAQQSSYEGLDFEKIEEAFNLGALLLLRACYRTAFSPKQSLRFRGEDKAAPSQATQAIISRLLQDEFVLDLLSGLVQNFFVLLPQDLEEWTDDAEEWERKMEGSDDSYNREVKPCAERLFHDVLLHSQEQVMIPLMKTIHQVTQDPKGHSVDFKDAIFNAIGLGAPMLKQQFNFNDFLMKTVVPELQNHNPEQTLLRRGIALVLAKWSVIENEISPDSKSIVYQIFLHLLDPELACNSLVVRLTAARQLQVVVDEIYFDQARFAPCASVILTRLLGLIQEVSVSDTKMTILETIGFVVERMGTEVNPFAEQIVNLLLPLWNAADIEHLMKQRIVDLLAKLITAMKANSAPLHPIVLPIIGGELERKVTSGSVENLLNESLELWAAVVHQSEQPVSADFTNLATHIPSLLSMDMEKTSLCLEITEELILLAPSTMLRDGLRGELVYNLSELLMHRKSDIADLATDCITSMIRNAENLGGEQAVIMLSRELEEANVFKKAFDSLHITFQSNQMTGPRKKPPPTDAKNTHNYLFIFSRLIMASLRTFINVTTTWTSDLGEELDTTLAWYSDLVFEEIENLVMPADGKLVTLAMTKLLELEKPLFLGKLQSYMSLWTSQVVNLQHDRDDHGSDCLVDHSDQSLAIPNETPQERRDRAFLFADPVRRIVLGQFIKHHLQQAVQMVGSEETFQQEFLSNVDKDVVAAFMNLQIM